MGIASARHRDRAAHILEAVAGFVRNRVVGFLEFEAWRETATLGHETGDQAVEDRAVIKARVHKVEKIGDGQRGLAAIQFELEIAFGCLDKNMRMSGYLVGGPAE